MLKDIELLEIVEHATTRNWGPDQTRTDYSNPYNVIAYCSERMSQIPFQLSVPNQPDEEKARILTRLYFFNGVNGRVAFLEGKTLESSSYSSFRTESGENQIDIFLNRIGYKR